ncbi:phytanoyl-CoA dioxygenase family protein [Micromonospora mirobrigensis]|uniref:Phytanoyl-CoA dioxygenase (PhyH) n=1 Tax=Micromonospora mirobrigensis TaxID=262898 RepID=A0A1C4ZA17_9ACTN|nr:phytanoyl-CoA dioxygenase family protein [Micromonospora mirobrigensis]SCF29757.1 Phytanoyl-CoA dioxygenase (PhyH) [Micromonospora mirobrigensis]
MTPHATPATTRPAGPADEAETPVEALGDLYRDGITACRGAFSPDWVRRVGEDVDAAFQEARSRPDGAVGRGPQRWYVEIHPEQLRGFVDLVTHPWVVSVCRAVLGPDYEIVELGFDIPFPGAAMQPWHRDFPMPEETRLRRRLTSLAFNLTTVDTVEAMGPFEIAPGTQWDDGRDFDHEMFPPKERYPRYESRAVRKYPKRGDISARSALTVHRGTPNVSDLARPVLVLGVDAPGAGNAGHHDLAVTRGYWESLPELVRAHLHCPVVDALEPIRQKHTIEGLVMGAE